MLAHQVPQLPPSARATIAVVTGLTRAQTGGLPAAAVPAMRSVREVIVKGTRMIAEIESMEACLSTIQALLAEGLAEGPEHSPSETASRVERLSEEVARSLKAKERVRQSIEMLAKAADEARQYSQIVERTSPGWTAAIDRVAPVTAELLRDLKGLDLEDVAESAAPELQSTLSLALAEQGLLEWGAQLPADEEPLVDADAGLAVTWTSEQGWAVGR